MITLRETIDIERAAADAYNYLKNFASCQEWDPTVLEAELTTTGPIVVGSEFKVKCALPVGAITLRYTVDTLEENKKIVLTGESRFFTVVDTIDFQETAGGTHVVYTAEFEMKGFLANLQDQLRPGFEKMGAESVQEGLKTALEDNYPEPSQSARSRLEDKLILPGVSRFTRRGYRLGKKHWNPVSANISQKHILLTGATAGLGLSAARELAAMGAMLTLVVRDEGKGRDLIDQLEAETGNSHIKLEIADLSLMKDTDNLVRRLKKNGTPIDVCINNAGALFNDWQLTEEGLERGFALLLLAPYRLLKGIKPLLTNGARIINVVSGGMYTQKLRIHELHADSDGFQGAAAYARAKRALVIMTEELAKQWAQDGIVVNSMHPGWAATPGVESSLPSFYKITRAVLRTAEEGADTMVWLAAATEAGKVSGKLFLDREPHPTHLLSSTRETEAQRRALLELMDRLVTAKPAKVADHFDDHQKAA